MRRLRPILFIVLLGLITFGSIRIASAHAVLVRSVPASNEVLAESPAEIRLWFSEPIEPRFSNFVLLDSTGQKVNVPASQVDPNGLEIFMAPGKLPNGLYTVSWENVSAADGHPSDGSFAFGIGIAAIQPGAVTQATEVIPADSTLIRWLNLLGLSLMGGSIGFVMFVWRPAIPMRHPESERRMVRLMWIGWVVAGVTGVLMLLLQVSLAAHISIFAALTNPALGQLIGGTRYGLLWLLRTALWVELGFVLAFAPRNLRLLWLGLAFVIGMLATNSLFSHASATPDAFSAVISDWLHLTLTVLWFGGLVQFINVLGPIRRAVKSNAAEAVIIGHLVAYFSNFARIAVVGLFVTGLYAGWLQVGSLEALFGTVYGQILIVKLVLILPLLLLAAVNLTVTSRNLQDGKVVWTRRLQKLVGTEIVFVALLFIAVGAMTSITPARTALAQREALAATTTSAQPIVDTQSVDDLQVKLSVSPGWVGLNTFTLNLTTADGQPVNDASLIRLRFDDQTQNLGQSELRIQQGNNGAYIVSGANLSQAGQWRIRVSIQRPGKFDSVLDFTPTVALPPSPPVPDANNPLNNVPNRFPALLLIGLLTVTVGGIFQRQINKQQEGPNAKLDQRANGIGLLCSGVILVGGIFLFNSVVVLGQNRLSNQKNAESAIQISLNQASPAVTNGQTNLIIYVRDATGTAIENAKVEVNADMAGMPTILGNKQNGAQGLYTIPFRWSMGGTWTLTIKVTLPDGRTKQQAFKITVSNIS